MIIFISRSVADPIQRPVKLVHAIGFAIAGFIGCWAGSGFGNWIYRESEEVAARTES